MGAPPPAQQVGGSIGDADTSNRLYRISSAAVTAIYVLLVLGLVARYLG